MYARMIIGEATGPAEVQEFIRIYNSIVVPELEQQPGFDSAHLMFEDGGVMAVSLTMWKTREQCLHYHSSRSYRQFVSRTQHLLAGTVVVKIFRDCVQ